MPFGGIKNQRKEKEVKCKKEEERGLIRNKSKGLTYMRYQVRAAEYLSVASLGNDGYLPKNVKGMKMHLKQNSDSSFLCFFFFLYPGTLTNHCLIKFTYEEVETLFETCLTLSSMSTLPFQIALRILEPLWN
jgi:hypothetical protein